MLSNPPKQTELRIFGITVLFDGGCQPLGDQYIPECEGGGRNLHIYKIGSYQECYGCKHQAGCIDGANCAGEQAEP